MKTFAIILCVKQLIIESEFGDNKKFLMVISNSSKRLEYD